MDLLISGAILIDVGKLIEYDKVDGKLTTSKAGKLLRHPFSGVAIADRFGLPPEVQHIIAYHAKEGDDAKRSVEAIIVHHADFVSFEPFKVDYHVIASVAKQSLIKMKTYFIYILTNTSNTVFIQE